MEKIDQPRGIAIDAEAPDGVRFGGERQGLDGLTLSNASIGGGRSRCCRWCKQV